MKNNKAAKPTVPADDRYQGQKFIQVLNNLLSTARIHQDNNRLLIGCVNQFIEVVEQLFRESGEIVLLVSVGGFYLQQEKVIFQRNLSGLVRKMQVFFEERQLDGLRLYQSVTYASLKDIVDFARILNNCASKDDPVHWLVAKMDGGRFPWVEIIDPSQTESLESIFAEAAAPASRTETVSPQAPEAVTERSASTVTVDKNKSNTAGSRGSAESKKPGRSRGGKQKSVPPSEGKKVRQKKKAMRTYGYAMHSLQDLSTKLSGAKHAGIGKVVHITQNMVDLIMDDDNVLLSLSTIRDYDDYTFTHSVNVAILAICLGNRIGLPRVTLANLGMGGLFHDLGKLDVPVEILNKPGKLIDAEFATIQKHPLNSVRRIIRLRASYDKKAGILLPPFEHHLKYDLSGYPKTPRKRPLSLLGRILTIADVYDAVTSRRIYHTRFLSPDQALGLMLQGSGKEFDPILLKVFINMLGIYPIGTILKFEKDELGIVTQPPEDDARLSELWVLMLRDNGDGSYTKLYKISLGKWNPEAGGFNRPILESCHPSELGIQPAEFIF